ncbi:ATP-binding protein [Sphingomonas sp. NFX23]|uniref:ATP-binding protein n=1 Tax=Sphingomonas sp. NFX23 TaxID=2819532 RepID=UPI003CF188D0
MATHLPSEAGPAIILLGLAVAMAVVWCLHRRAHDRRLRLEAMHSAVFTLLLDGPSSELGLRIEDALADLGSIIGVDQVWLLVGGDADVDAFYGWSADGSHQALTQQDAEARTARIVDRFPWDENTILVEPGARSVASWNQVMTRQRGTWATTLMMRSREHQDLVLLCLTARNRWVVYPETIHGLASALQTALQLEQRHRLETERLVIDQKMALGRRMEAIGALASGLSHNLNNILTAIDGFRATAALHVPANGVVSANLVEIGQAVKRASGLVSDVLHFGRRVEGPAETVSLAALLAETHKLVTAALPSGVTLDWQTADEPMHVEGDFGQLQQVLLNLCSNADNAMAGGGAIACVSTFRLLDDPIKLSHNVLRRGRYATIAVSDEGRGIPAQAIPHIFDAFYTTRQGGTGLGLSTAREIIEAAGGAIDIDSIVGVGSRFTVWIPLAADGDAPLAGDVNRGTGETVLIVNTDGQRLSNDEELFAALGYEPIGITSPETLDAIEGDIDVAVVASFDPRLADELAARLRIAGITAPLLVAVPQPEFLGQVVQGGAVVRYPFQPANLAHALALSLVPNTPEGPSTHPRVSSNVTIVA